MEYFGDIKQFLDAHAQYRNCDSELCFQKPDPLVVAKKYQDEYISLFCALFAYGNAKLIVNFLNSFDFDIVKESESDILKYSSQKYYRFQNSVDIANLLITIKRLKEQDSINNIIFDKYRNNNFIIDGLRNIIKKILSINSYSSKGYDFLISKIPSQNPTSAYKRWNMYFRWMVRKDKIDMGLWKNIDKKDLLIPLDVHVFGISRKLNLLNRKICDFKAVIELTQKLKEFDPQDPIKYDFAIYRIGQEKII